MLFAGAEGGGGGGWLGLKTILAATETWTCESDANQHTAQAPIRNIYRNKAIDWRELERMCHRQNNEQTAHRCSIEFVCCARDSLSIHAHTHKNRTNYTQQKIIGQLGALLHLLSASFAFLFVWKWIFTLCHRHHAKPICRPQKRKLLTKASLATTVSEWIEIHFLLLLGLWFLESCRIGGDMIRSSSSSSDYCSALKVCAAKLASNIKP